VADLLTFPGAPATDLAEPKWATVIPGKRLRAIASAAWRAAYVDMRAAGTLSAGNADALRRYALAVALHHDAAAHVFADGAVIERAEGQLPAWNLWLSAMKKAAAECESMEAELGISPRRRAAAGAAKPRGPRKPSPADAYLPARG
jgi:phage terminase small subunit